MTNNKYYKLSLFSIVGGTFYAVCENGKYYELLTNKEIMMWTTNHEEIKEDLLNSDCKLIGIFPSEISEVEVAKFLKFLNEAQKEEMLNKINISEEFINSYKNSLISNKNKVKTK